MEGKQLAGEKAAEFVEDGMVVGLGTGSTVYFALQRLGQLVREGLDIRGIPTSRATEALAVQLGIRLVDFDAMDRPDLTIDGADQVTPTLDLIKGGGGALLREKLVAAASRRLIIVADERKVAPVLGGVPLPVEVVPFAWQATLRRLAEFDCRVSLRLDDGVPFVSDNGNYIAECDFAAIPDPAGLQRELKLLPGVIETGLFTGMADLCITGGADGVHLHLHTR